MRSDGDVCSSPCPILRIHSSGAQGIFHRVIHPAPPSRRSPPTTCPRTTHTDPSYEHEMRVPAARISIFVSFVTAKCVCRHVYIFGGYCKRCRNLFFFAHAPPKYYQSRGAGIRLFVLYSSVVVNMGGLGGGGASRSNIISNFTILHYAWLTHIILFYSVSLSPPIYTDPNVTEWPLEQRIIMFHTPWYTYLPITHIVRKSSNAVHLYKDSRYLCLHRIALSIL